MKITNKNNNLNKKFKITLKSVIKSVKTYSQLPSVSSEILDTLTLFLGISNYVQYIYNIAYYSVVSVERESYFKKSVKVSRMVLKNDEELDSNWLLGLDTFLTLLKSKKIESVKMVVKWE